MAFTHAHAVHSSYGRGTLQIIIENVKCRFAIFHDFYIAPWSVCTSDGFSKGNKAANLGITVLLIEMIGRHIPVREQEDLLEAHFLYGLFDLCQEKGSGTAALTVSLDAQFVDDIFCTRVPVLNISHG